MAKKLAGQQILEHDSLRLDLEDDISEYRASMESDIMARIYDTARKAKGENGYTNTDFYIVLITTTDRVLKQPKVITLARKSCPTPVYKQSVWKYHNFSDSLDFLWSIPDEILYYHIINNKDKYLLDKETADIAKFVLLMESGDLLDWVKKENSEGSSTLKKDAVIKIQPREEETECIIT